MPTAQSSDTQKQLIEKFELSKNKDPQQYGIGFKEIWEVSDEKHQEGLVMHTAGWPLDKKNYGGSFVYHAEKKQIYKIASDYYGLSFKRRK